MRPFLILIFLLLLSLNLKAQSEEKNIFGVQTGFLGIWTHYETGLSNEFVLRTEVGLDSGIWRGSFYKNTGFLMTPVLTLEPRWYYNLPKRAEKGKDIAGYGANFISVKTSYHPDWFVITNQPYVRIVSDISFVPTWGIRRNIGRHFNYEAGAGMGVRIITSRIGRINRNKPETALNLHLRIGYRF